MTYQAMCYLLIAWMQITGVAECFSEKAVDRFFGFVQFGTATALLFSVEWWVQ